MNPCAPSSQLSNTLSSLGNLVRFSHHTLAPAPQTLNADLIQCPFNPHHLMPPPSLFSHFLRCPSSPRPIPHSKQLLLSLTYPKTLNNRDNHDDDDYRSITLDRYLDFASNFFYRGCPGVVTFSGADSINRTLTLPDVLSAECAKFSTEIPEKVLAPILPSEYWGVMREVESWNDYPTVCSYTVLRALTGMGIAKDCDLMRWIIANSPRYGVVIDAAMQQHIFLLFCLCYKSILRAAFVSIEVLMNKKNSEFGLMGMISDCPILVQALTWLASQVSILYGATNGKLFVLNFFKNCILDGASGLLMFPLGETVTEAPALKEESKNLDTNSGNIKDAKPHTQHQEVTKFIQNNTMDKTVWGRKIVVSQVAAAVAALYERSLLEDKIKGLWFSQQPNKYQLVAEHGHVSAKANEERRKRPDYRPIIDHDGLHRQQSSAQETSSQKTREELLAEERDYKRRRMSYRGKKIRPSTVQVMRDIIEEYMEEMKQAGGVERHMNVSEEHGMFPSGHDIPIEAINSRKVDNDSPAVTVSNPRYYDHQSHLIYGEKSKAVEDVFSRDYEHPKLGYHRNHDYVGDHRNSGRGKYHRESTSPEKYRSHSRSDDYVENHRNTGRHKYHRESVSPARHRSHNQSQDHSIHHKKQDYSNKKKYDHLSRTRDRWQRDTHRSHVSDSFPKSAFEDRYNPSESLDVCEASDAKYIEPAKFDNKELH